MVWRATIAALAVAVLPASAASQGIGDAAAREKQRRSKPAAESAPVVTDDDLARYAGERPEPAEPTAGSTDPADQPGAAAVPPAQPGPSSSDARKRARAEGYKERLGPAENRVKDAEAELAAAEAHWGFVNSHTNQSFPLTEARYRLASAKARVEEARKQRDELADGARREGIPPGWLR